MIRDILRLDNQRIVTRSRKFIVICSRTRKRNVWCLVFYLIRTVQYTKKEIASSIHILYSRVYKDILNLEDRPIVL